MSEALAASNDYPLRPLVASYLMDVRRQGRSPHTLSSYESLLTAQVPTAWTTVRDITLPAVRAWLDAGADHKSSTLKWRWVALRSFLAWLDREEYPVDPRFFKRGLIKIRVPEQEPETLTMAEVHAMMKAAWHPYQRRPVFSKKRARTYQRLIRNQLMIRTLFCTGLRISELLRLTAEDVVEGEQTYLRVRLGKGNKDRIVPLPEDGHLALELRRFVHDFVPAGSPMFAIGTKGAEQMLKAAAKRAGLERRIYPHLFRHTFASDYLNNGGQESKLQRVLGHTTSTMTNRYVHYKKADILRGWKSKDPGRTQSNG